MKKFAVFDIDGTLIRWQLYHAVADCLAKQGFIDNAAYSAIREARQNWKKRINENAFKEYEGELVKAYDRALTQLSFKQFEQAADIVFDEYKDQVYTYTRDLLKTLKQDGYLLWAISGSQAEIVERIANYYGFDDCVGSNYERKGAGFSGKKHVVANDKATVLKGLIDKYQVTKSASIAVGDSESDIPMLELVDCPIAFNPTRILFETARSRRWSVVVERKNMIYNLEAAADGKYILA